MHKMWQETLEQENYRWWNHEITWADCRIQKFV